jgi:adenine-specific DNA-methyltransferase
MEFETIISALGRPTDRGSNWALYQGDSMELLSTLPESCLPLIVTSPPYNIGKSYEQVRDVGEYIDWCAEWIELIYRATAKDGALWLNLGYLAMPERAKAVPIPYLLWDRVPFFLVQEIVWNYGAGVAARHSFSPRNEKFLWYVKDPENYTFNLDDVRDPDVKYPNQRKNGKLKCNPLGKNPTDVWQIPKVTSGTNRASVERTPHPAQFPIAVVERIVRACSNLGDVILDPFMGSGSLAEAALQSGRKVIGFEIKPEYVELSSKRLKAALAQPALL